MGALHFESPVDACPDRSPNSGVDAECNSRMATLRLDQLDGFPRVSASNFFAYDEIRQTAFRSFVMSELAPPSGFTGTDASPKSYGGCMPKQQ